MATFILLLLANGYTMDVNLYKVEIMQHSCMLVNHGPSRQSFKIEHKPWASLQILARPDERET